MKVLSLNSVSYCFFVRSRIKSSLTLSSSRVSLAWVEAWEAVRAIFSLMVWRKEICVSSCVSCCCSNCCFTSDCSRSSCASTTKSNQSANDADIALLSQRLTMTRPFFFSLLPSSASASHRANDAASNKLTKQQKAWPDKYPEGLSITVCKFRFDGRMIWHGDYSFENGKLKLNRKADPLLFQLGLV